MPIEDLLPHFEREMALLSRGLGQFAHRHPKVAARLGIANGLSEDPHVGRMLQSFALLAARIDAKLEDDYPEFTEALLEILYPAYLRPLPSCAIAQFDPGPAADLLSKPFIVSRGTELDARSEACRFRTVYDVTLSPLRIRHAHYTTAAIAPRGVALPPDVSGILSITFASALRNGRWDASLPATPTRLHLSGERPLVAALSDTLFLKTSACFVEADGGGRWTALSQLPFEPVGFDERDRLLPEGVSGIVAQQQQHSLLDYFVFPEMFDFIDIDMARLQRAVGNEREVTLHLAVRDAPADSALAQTLSALDANAFKLFCTPVVNLFKRAAAPILLTGADAGYPVSPVPLASGLPLSVYAIDSVQLQERMPTNDRAGNTEQETRTALQPYRNFDDKQAERADIYWIAFRDKEADPGVASSIADSPLRLSLLNLDGAPKPLRHAQLYVDVLASNGDFPSRMTIGAPEGDLLDEGAALSCRIGLLTRPTASSALPRSNGALWQVLTALTPQSLDLTKTGLASFKAFLRLHAARSPINAQRCIDAITNLSCTAAMHWMPIDGSFPSFVRGLEISLSFDEAALRTVSLSIFAKILDRFFACYAPTNSYVRLVVSSAQTGIELLRYAPQPGTRPLL